MTNKGKVNSYSTDITIEDVEEKERVTVKVKGDTDYHDQIYRHLAEKLDSAKEQVELKMRKENEEAGKQ